MQGYGSLRDHVNNLLLALEPALYQQQWLQTPHLTVLLTSVGLDHDINVTKLLREAIRKHDDDWLAAELRRRGYFKTHEERRNSRTGSVSQVRVPVTAADTLAEGEFNRFYIRGVCRRAINEGIAEVVIYRTKEVEQPRPESEARRGQRLPAEAVLNDLRNSPGVDTALGLPPGPNSGLLFICPST